MVFIHVYQDFLKGDAIIICVHVYSRIWSRAAPLVNLLFRSLALTIDFIVIRARGIV